MYSNCDTVIELLLNNIFANISLSEKTKHAKPNNPIKIKLYVNSSGQ